MNNLLKLDILLKNDCFEFLAALFEGLIVRLKHI